MQNDLEGAVTRTVNISSKWCVHKFNCTEEFIKTVCHGTCCQGSNKVVISLLPDEADWHIKNGFTVIAGLLQPDANTKKCPHKTPEGLCKLHYTDHKPFGCRASPFTLNKGNTLIIRQRNSLMKCHGHGKPAYETFRSSLDMIFGEVESERICTKLKEGRGDFYATIPLTNFARLKYLDALKQQIPLEKK